jgi:AcrR family transcriptional regulator
VETRAPTPKAQSTRRQILDAALELFRTRGFDQTTMRDIAERAGLAVGATYYYFRSKESLVLAFYADTQQAAEDHLRATLAGDRDFRRCMSDVIWYRLELLRPYRDFIAVLSSHLDPLHSVSPFGPVTRELRRRSIALIADAVKGSGLRTSRSLEPHLPLLLWLYQLAIVFFWIHDDSRDQQRTRQLVELSLKLLQSALRLSRSPLLRGLNRSLQQAMEIVSERLA